MKPRLQGLLLASISCFFAQSAYASFDETCSPTWTLAKFAYNSCSNLPMLSPANDNRVNLQLQLADRGLTRFENKPIKKDWFAIGYGRVPFAVSTFEEQIVFDPKRKIEPEKTDTSTESTVIAGDGTRCKSNESGTKEFIRAVNANKKVNQTDRDVLIAMRQKLLPTCSNEASTIQDVGDLTSVDAVQFWSYLKAITDFYDGNFDQAETGFTALVNSSDPWLREASAYMQARSLLNKAQQSAFDADGYPQLDKADVTQLAASEQAFQSYLKHYPANHFSASAKGLLRRVYWLSKQPGKLEAEFEWQLANPDSPQHNMSVNEFPLEADSKMLSRDNLSVFKTPLFLATLDLMMMRKEPESSGLKPITLETLEAQAPHFANQKPLFDYLIAAHYFYVQHDSAQAIAHLPDSIPNHPLNYLEFSQQSLKGLALEALKDTEAARKHWLSLLPVSTQVLQNEQVQLALAMNYEKSNEVAQVFAKNSPITDVAIRERLIRQSANPDLLRQLSQSDDSKPQERHIALHTLLTKNFLRANFAEFLQDVKRLPSNTAKLTEKQSEEYGVEPNLALFLWDGNQPADGVSCPSVVEIAKILNNNAQDPRGLICYGEFVRGNDFFGEAWMTADESSTKAEQDRELGDVLGHFSGKLFYRDDAYKAIMSNHQAPAAIQAYAYYRAINCYAPTGSNDCGGDEVDKSVRRNWFQTLRTKFPTSPLSTSLKYYW